MSFDFGEAGIVPAQFATQWEQEYRLSEVEGLSKATTTGNGIVQPGVGVAGDGSPLRTQFLHDTLETALYSQDDAKTMKLLPIEKVNSTTFEYTTLDKMGGEGDGFIGETGVGGNFGAGYEDDVLARRLRTMKYLGVQRSTGFIAQQVGNIKDPVAIAEMTAATQLVARANNALHFSDETFNRLGYSGLTAQIHEHVSLYPENRKILLNANNGVVDAGLLGAAQLIGIEQFGAPSLLLQDAGSYQDTEASLFQFQRMEIGSSGQFGGNRNEFVSTYGKVRREYDAMIRPNRPLSPQGTMASGKPRTSTSAVTWTASPWLTTGGSATAVIDSGTGNFYQNVTRSGVAPTTVPAKPALTDGGNNQSVNVAGDTHCYAVSFVVGGVESLPWVYGAATPGTITGATLQAALGSQVAATNSIVRLGIDAAQINVAGSQLPNTRIRIYRKKGLPSSISDFNLLCESGVAYAGVTPATTVVYDNGMYLPGANTNWLLTLNRNGAKSIFFASLLPMIKRALPNALLSDQFGMLMFGTPIMMLPNFQIEIRNVKSALT